MYQFQKLRGSQSQYRIVWRSHSLIKGIERVGYARLSTGVAGSIPSIQSVLYRGSAYDVTTSRAGASSVSQWSSLQECSMRLRQKREEESELIHTSAEAAVYSSVETVCFVVNL